VKLVITPLFIVTFFARDDHVAGDVQARSKSVHAVWMLNGCAVAFQQSTAVTTMSAELGFDCVNVFLISDIKSNLRVILRLTS